MTELTVELQAERSPRERVEQTAAESILRVGFLTYDLQRNTEDAIFEVSHSVKFRVKAFPLFRHDDQELSRVPYRPATAQCKRFGVNVKGSTPEGFFSNPEWAVGLDCARQSDVLVLKGLLGLGALWCALCARLLGRVVISTNQTLPVTWERKRRWWIRLSKRFLLGLCQYHIYQNPAAVEVLTQVYGCAPQRLISAPFEAGAALFSRILSEIRPEPDLRHRLGFESKVVFLYVGTLLPFKGVADIVSSASLISGQSPFLCVFVGPEVPKAKGGETIENYKEVARSTGVEHRVRFLPPMTPEELAKLYIAVDVVLLPTHKDCFPKVLVEAGLVGKPMVTTNACGSAGVIVQDGVNGFVIEPGDVSQLAEAMTKLLDPDLRARMGSRSREIVDQNCNMDLEVKGYVEAIERGAEHLDRRKKA